MRVPVLLVAFGGVTLLTFACNPTPESRQRLPGAQQPGTIVSPRPSTGFRAWEGKPAKTDGDESQLHTQVNPVPEDSAAQHPAPNGGWGTPSQNRSRWTPTPQ